MKLGDLVLSQLMDVVGIAPGVVEREDSSRDETLAFTGEYVDILLPPGVVKVDEDGRLFVADEPAQGHLADVLDGVGDVDAVLYRQELVV